MPVPVYTPRINNNDDAVRLAAVLVPVGAKVREGDPIIDVETDKATFTVESPTEGYLLNVGAQVGEMVQVGSVLAWLGASADEAIEAPGGRADGAGSAGGAVGEPTLKALLLLKQYGLSVGEVPASGGRLSAADVERYYRAHGGPARERAQAPVWIAPATAGHVEPFTRERRGMLNTVTWHRDEAAPGYVEIPYAPSSWETYADEFSKRHRLLFSPLLALMSWKLSRLAIAKPRFNAVASPEGAFHYEHVNLGFTVQSGEDLYIVVVRDAEQLDEPEFVKRLGELQRAAMKRSLTPEQTSDATLSFSSMARWSVSRHIPVLPPFTSLIVAHTAPLNGVAVLGATYDHRLLTGFDVVHFLTALSTPASVDDAPVESHDE
jgi:pyruvate/2-oxoglutarate dehydrogenase complex dihydrolipoamide acyltransferase (E2) component